MCKFINETLEFKWLDVKVRESHFRMVMGDTELDVYHRVLSPSTGSCHLDYAGRVELTNYLTSTWKTFSLIMIYCEWILYRQIQK